MARTRKNNEETAETVEKAEEASLEKIALTPTEFGREDLNALAKKVNEIINRVNG